MGDKKCPPSSGWKSKSANKDGLTHWCEKTRKMAAEQEGDEYWLLVIGFPPPNTPSVRFVRVSGLSVALQKKLIDSDGGEWSDIYEEDNSVAVDNELKQATVTSCYVDKVMRHYVG